MSSGFCPRAAMEVPTLRKTMLSPVEWENSMADMASVSRGSEETDPAAVGLAGCWSEKPRGMVGLRTGSPHGIK